MLYYFHIIRYGTDIVLIKTYFKIVDFLMYYFYTCFEWQESVVHIAFGSNKVCYLIT